MIYNNCFFTIRNSLYVNDVKIEFSYDIADLLFSDGIILVRLEPSSKDDNVWHSGWNKLKKSGNIMAYDMFGKQLWKFPKPIRILKSINHPELKYFKKKYPDCVGLSSLGEIFIVKIKTGEIVHVIDTKYDR